MEWFIAVLAVAALGVAAMAAAGGAGQMSKDPVHDTFRATLPDHPLTGTDLQGTRFAVAFRGYSMAQIDDLIDRLAREIDARDARIAELSGHPLTQPFVLTEPADPLPELVEGPEPVHPIRESVEGPSEPRSGTPVAQP